MCVKQSYKNIKLYNFKMNYENFEPGKGGNYIKHKMTMKKLKGKME